MESFDDLLRQAELAHGHLCAGQILGVRMAMLGCSRLGIAEPRTTDRKRLVTFVEIDRCATDAIGVVTGCRLGKRALKVRDWGKMAATFVDSSRSLIRPRSSNRKTTPLPTRPSASPPSKTPSSAPATLYPHIENKNQQQMLAYRELPDTDLFHEQWVQVPLHPREMPGYKSAPHRLRPLRRGHQLRPQHHRRQRPHPLPVLRRTRDKLLPAPDLIVVILSAAEKPSF